MFQNLALKALPCVLALSVCTPSLATDRPSEPLSMVEIILGNGALVRIASTDPTPPGYDESGIPYRDFRVNETQRYDAKFGKVMSDITLTYLNPMAVFMSESIQFTLDPSDPIGDVDKHSYFHNAGEVLPNLYFNDSYYQDFSLSENRFSIVDFQRDAAGKITSFAGNFDVWGNPYRQGRVQISGRFWFNSAALNVPEPDTIALLLAGGGIMVLVTRRKAAVAH